MNETTKRLQLTSYDNLLFLLFIYFICNLSKFSKSKESISKTTRAVYFLGWEGAGVGIMSKGADKQSLQA